MAGTRKQVFTSVFTIKYYLGRKKREIVSWLSLPNVGKEREMRIMIRRPNAIYLPILQWKLNILLKCKFIGEFILYFRNIV